MTEHKPDNGQEIPDNVIVLSNGQWKDKETGRFIAGGKNKHTIKDPTQASALARQRWDNYIAAAETGTARAAKRDTSLAAYERMVENITNIALDPENGRTAVEAFKEVSKALDARPDRRSNTQFFVQNAQIAVVPGELLAGIVDDMSTVDGQVVDSDDNDYG